MKWVTNTNEKTTEWRLTFNRTKFFYNFQNLIFLNKSYLNSDLLIKNIETAEMLYQRKKILVGEFQPQHSYLIFFGGGGGYRSRNRKQCLLYEFLKLFSFRTKLEKQKQSWIFIFLLLCLFVWEEIFLVLNARERVGENVFGKLC